MKEEHGNVILKRIKKRLRGLAAMLLAVVLVFSGVTPIRAIAEESDNYYIVNSKWTEYPIYFGKGNVTTLTGTQGLYGTGKAYLSFDFDKKEWTENKTQELNLIRTFSDGDKFSIEFSNDVKLYYGNYAGSGAVCMILNDNDNYDKGDQGNPKSITIPKGKYTIEKTSNYNANENYFTINTIIEKITFSVSTLDFEIGDDAKTLTVLPEGAEVTWTTSDKNVASVDSDGKVIPVGPGKATITATLNDDEKVSAKCEVIVSAKSEDVPVHTHTFVYKEAKEATYTEAGYKAHYECTECNMWAEDANGNHVYTKEEMKELIIPPKTKPNEGGSSSSSSSDSDSDSDSSGGGSSGRSGSISTKSIDVDGNTVQTQPDSGAPLSDRGGNWGNQEYDWTYTKSDGSLAKGEWLNLEYDGHTYWYYFDDSTIMQTNWFDYNGSRYFLVPEMDGWRGRMATGWHMVDNKWYYFEPTIGANQGILFRGMTTPDGHTVGADGAWDGNGTTPVGAIHTGTTVTTN